MYHDIMNGDVPSPKYRYHGPQPNRYRTCTATGIRLHNETPRQKPFHKMIPPAFVFLSVLLLTSVLCEVCDLACRNSGECKFGSADYSFESDTFDDDQLPFAEHIDGKYCKCISGWTGVQCEIKFVICGENKHTCFNGAPCQADASGLFHCECDAAKSDLSSVYAGQFCEHVATVFCTTNDPTTGQPAKHSFCTNGGRCKEFVNYDVE